ncbi:MAG: Na+/H+ antiporter NhaA, partial [Micrococcales bacterium]|nr:Na+/H+ antiporter NhaA [Micrococcales bacterium]
LGVAMLGGIGFTVSLLIGDLAFGPGTPGAQSAKVAILIGSLGSAALAAILIKRRDRAYERMIAAEEGDQGEDLADPRP